MKLAVSTYSLARWQRENARTLEQSLEWIANEAGVDGVEFTPIGEDAKDLARRAGQLRKRCEKLGLRVVSYCVGAELLVAPAEQKAVVERLKREIDAAAILGAPSLRHDVTRGTGATSFSVLFA